MIRTSTALAVLACCSFGAPLLAHAQGFGSGSVAQHGFAPVKTAEPPKPGLPPPPALPGVAGSAPAAPPEQLPLDMSPNDALFDAIDRGDIGAAKDALSRGADLDAVNVLGMTPLEASVDLGRNDITFLLLSLRGASASGRAGVVGAGPGAAGGKASQAAAAAAAQLKLATRVTPRRAATPRPYQEAAQPRVRYTVTDNNAADPNSGFLGFGPAQP